MYVAFKTLLAVARRKIAWVITRGISPEIELFDYFSSKNESERVALHRRGIVTVISTQKADQTRRVYLRLGTSDVAVYDEIFVDRHYEAAIQTAKYYAQVEQIDSIIDVGANIGLSALYFAEYFRSASIIAVEPNPSNFALLRENAKNVSGDLAIQLVNAAAWPDHVKLRLQNDHKLTREWAYSYAAGSSSTEAPDVEVVTLRELKRRSRGSVHLLKMDIEGGEYAFFANQQQTADTLADVLVLVVEFHSSPSETAETLKKIRDEGYVIQPVGELTVAVRSR